MVDALDADFTVVWKRRLSRFKRHKNQLWRRRPCRVTDDFCRAVYIRNIMIFLLWLFLVLNLCGFESFDNPFTIRTIYVCLGRFVSTQIGLDTPIQKTHWPKAQEIFVFIQSFYTPWKNNIFFYTLYTSVLNNYYFLYIIHAAQNYLFCLKNFCPEGY